MNNKYENAKALWNSNNKYERLILRPFQYTDDNDMLDYWIRDLKIRSLYSEPAYNTKEKVKELLDKYIGSYQKTDYYRWAIIEGESGI